MSNTEFYIEEFEKEINKNYVIEASAGTGKTYTIVEMVKGLLKNGVTLDKMLIVTYTEKAAGELKDRIRSGLAQMSPDIKDNVANDVDNASIGTIHAFCQNIINEYFISAGKPSCQKLIDESEIKEFLKRYIRKGEIYDEICDYKVANADNQIEGDSKNTNLINKIAAYIEKYYLNSNAKIDSSIIEFDDFNEAIISKYIFEKAEITDAIRTLSKSNEEKVRAFAEYVHNKKSVDYTEFKYGKRPTGLTPAGCKTDEDKNAFNIIKEAKKDLSNYIKEQGKAKEDFFNKIIVKYIDKIYLAWQKEKENLCAQTYNDMIRNVREEVMKADSKLLKKIREKYTYAIIDEFQDTNQKQWDIFKTAFLSEEHNLIVVGDPKQSIYSFQGADVTVYQKAKKEIAQKGGIVRSLKKNYRATSDIIKSTNGFFHNSNALPETFGFENSEVGNDKLKATYKGKEIEAFWITGSNVSPEDYAKIVCNKIVDFCSKDETGKTNLQIWDKDDNQMNVSFKDFAVLARTRSEMKPIQNAFEKCGIPYTQYKDNALFSGRECANWIAVLEAINVSDFTGYNRIYFKKAMFTYFFGYSFDDIRSSYFDKDSTKEIEMFAEWREIAENREWAKLIEKIFADTDVFEKTQSLCDIKTFGVLMQIGEYCVDYLTKTDNLEMLIRNLRKQSSNNNDEEEDKNAGMISKSTDMDCVKIMTIHASKGLEFPVVISVAGFKGENNQVVKASTYHDNDKNYLTFSNIEISKQEAKEELQRLFYVAYTRAKYLLMLPEYSNDGIDKFIKKSIAEYKGNNNIQQDGCIYKYQPMTDEDDFDQLKARVTELLNSKEKSEATQEKIEERTKELKNFGENIYLHTSQKHAYSSLSHGGEKKDESKIDTVTIENDVLKHNNEEDTEDDGLSKYDKSSKIIDCVYDSKKGPIELSPDFIAGAGIGNVLHRVFELIDYTKGSSDIDSLIQKCFEEEKIKCKGGWIDDVKNMTQNVLGAKLPGIKGNDKDETTFLLKDITYDNRKNEVEFNFNIPEKGYAHHYMNGFVDLIFRRGDYYSVLDWKSDRLNEEFTCYYDSKELKKHVDEHYSIQRVLYSYCLIKWLKQIFGGTEQEVFENHFGGIYYIFLRGCNENTGNGVYAQTWENFADLENEYNNIVKEKVH